MWQGIIAALLAAFGPKLAEWVAAWLDSIFKKAVKRLPPAETYSGPPSASRALIDAALADTPKLAFARRAFLRALRTHVGGVSVGFDVSPQAVEELADAAEALARAEPALKKAPKK